MTYGMTICLQVDAILTVQIGFCKVELDLTQL